jgi:hypothetical protein
MSIDYSKAGPWAQHVRALAIVESGENEHKLGDGGRAYGLLQMHPGRFNEESQLRREFALTPADTWTSAQIKAAASYFEDMKGSPLELTVMAWNLGRAGVFLDGRRNPDYWRAWQAAFERIAAGQV